MTLFLVFVIPWVFFIADIGEFAQQHSGLRNYAVVIYFVAFGLLSCLLATLGAGATGRQLTWFGSVCILGGLVLWLGEFVFE